MNWVLRVFPRDFAFIEKPGESFSNYAKKKEIFTLLAGELSSQSAAARLRNKYSEGVTSNRTSWAAGGRWCAPRRCIHIRSSPARARNGRPQTRHQVISTLAARAHSRPEKRTFALYTETRDFFFFFLLHLAGAALVMWIFPSSPTKGVSYSRVKLYSILFLIFYVLYTSLVWISANQFFVK